MVSGRESADFWSLSNCAIRVKWGWWCVPNDVSMCNWGPMRSDDWVSSSAEGSAVQSGVVSSSGSSNFGSWGDCAIWVEGSRPASPESVDVSSSVRSGDSKVFRGVSYGSVNVKRGWWSVVPSDGTKDWESTVETAVWREDKWRSWQCPSSSVGGEMSSGSGSNFRGWGNGTIRVQGSGTALPAVVLALVRGWWSVGSNPLLCLLVSSEVGCLEGADLRGFGDCAVWVEWSWLGGSWVVGRSVVSIVGWSLIV